MVRLVTICALALASSGGCFTPNHDRCAVSCAADNGCPSGFTCLSDNFCHASQTESLCAAGGDGGVEDAGVDAGPGCGNGVRETANNEECDDNNTDDGDGCSANCREELNHVCVGDNGELSVCRPNPSQAGDLVITEIHANPNNNNDMTHEWFELFNPTSTDFDLRDMVVRDDGTENFTVNRSIPLPAGGHVVLGRNDNMAANGGVDVAFAYGGAFLLSNNSDEIEVRFNNMLIDRITYIGPTEGATRSLSAQTYDAVSNDMSANFCDGVDSFGDNGDLGTPGAMNPDC